MFENKKIYIGCVDQNVPYSRIIASYRNAGGYIENMDYDDFVEWLGSLGITDGYTVADIVELAINGKIELEHNAEMFLKYKNSKKA